MRRVMFVVGLAAVLGGCFKRPLDFTVRSIQGIRVVGIDATGFTMYTTCRLENPNPMGAELRNIQFTTYIGPHLVGRGRIGRPVTVDAHSRFTLVAPLHIAYADLPADFPRWARNGTVRLRVEASFAAHLAVGTFALRARYNGPVRVDEAVNVAIQGPFRGDSIKVTSIAVVGMNLRHTRLRFHLQARNKLAFATRFRRGEVMVTINGERFGAGTLDKPLLLPPRSVRTFQVEVRATHGALGQSVVALLGGDPVIRVTGTLWIDPIAGVSRLPIDVTTDASVFDAAAMP